MNNRKVKLYIAISLDGKIAKADGSVGWLEDLPNPDRIDYGYTDFTATIDTTLMGNSTYQMILSFGIDFPYADKTNYVFTRDASLQKDDNVTFISQDIGPFVRELKAKPGKDIWLIGGAQINTLLLNLGLVDELMIFVMPIVLGAGIDLFAEIPKTTYLNLLGSTTYNTGAVELRYEIKN